MVTFYQCARNNILKNDEIIEKLSIVQNTTAQKTQKQTGTTNARNTSWFGSERNRIFKIKFNKKKQQARNLYNLLHLGF